MNSSRGKRKQGDEKKKSLGSYGERQIVELLLVTLIEIHQVDK